MSRLRQELISKKKAKNGDVKGCRKGKRKKIFLIFTTATIVRKRVNSKVGTWVGKLFAVE